jgi:predicted Zn finger-like uncharacterized protein
MILTCPQCASRYQVADDSVPPQGRTVRCAGCGSSWRAGPHKAEDTLELTPAAPLDPAEAEPVKPAGADLPKSYRAKTEAIRRTRSAAMAGVVWGAMGAAVLALFAASVLFRVEVVRLWPRTAGAYAKVGLTVNPTGLAPENVLAGPGLKNGHAAVIVSGVVRNVESRSHDPAPLRVALLDKAGKTLVAQVVHTTPGRMQPGQTRPFSTAFLDPPSAAANVQVEFALDLAPAGRPKPAKLAEAETPKLRGPVEPTLPPAPAPRLAEPLAADSPYALPPAAEANTHRPHDG